MSSFRYLSQFVFLSSFLLLSATPALSTVYQSPTELTASEYDFIIVGGGTAGLVLANRLTEDADTSVLVVESGASFDGNMDLEVPFLGVSLSGTSVDWNYTTVAQSGYNGRSIPYTRGHVLSGSSSINLLTYNRGSNGVWDRLATASGDAGWSWDAMESYYLKSSTLVPPADGHDTTGEVDPSAHGDGPVQVSLAGFPLEIDSYVMDASNALGGRYAYTEDFNAGCTVGIGYIQNTIGAGARSSSGTAYYTPVSSRTNLDVLLNTRVTRLLNTAEDGDTPVFDSVELEQSLTVHATNEVILAAGTIGTPQILQLSGIGDSAALSGLGIEPIVDLPDVGTNLQDHPMAVVYLQVNSTKGWDDVTRNDTVFGDYLAEWESSRQGLFVDSPANTLAFMRLPSNASIFEQYSDPSPDDCSAHTELLFVDGFAAFGGAAQPATGNYITILAAVVSPLSRGTVTLASSDPYDNPLIDPAFFTNDFDTYAMVQALNDIDELIASPAWAGYVTGSIGAFSGTDTSTDAAKLAFARENSYNVNHAVGTAPMSPAGASTGVVNPDLTVKGTAKLRVVDASVFPVIPPNHPQALVYMIAERAADLIKTAYSLD